ncbi:NAD(P)-binding protein [Whalleya microplaca]|nr:NAD(P)-binding protein [Whalleya microplaca]
MTPKTVAFFGASTGVGLAALRHSLAAGCNCTALFRDLSKLNGTLTPETMPNLKVVQGNAHDSAAVSSCLKTSEGRFVDEIIFTIGGRFIMSKMTLDDPNVCEKGISTILEAITDLRRQGVPGRPYIVACSTTGVSRFARDVPLAIVPLYRVLLRVPGADKRAMEDKLTASTEDFTIVRASGLVDGETDKMIHVGIEDPKTGIESKAIGYSISREDTGRWIAQNLVRERHTRYLNKTVSITN